MNTKFILFLLAILLLSLSLASLSNAFTAGARRPVFNGKRSMGGKRGLSHNKQVCEVTFIKQVTFTLKDGYSSKQQTALHCVSQMVLTG